jgi:hypothetical protein
LHLPAFDVGCGPGIVFAEAAGGDNYPEILSRANSRNILASVVSAYIAGESPLSLPGEPLEPKIEGRIVCQGAGCPAPAAR